MGGDNAPGEIVKGAVDAVTERKDITVCLTGQKDVIEKELSKYTYKIEQIEIVDAPEVIETGEPPVNAIRKKKNSSLVVGLNLVKNGEADGFVSAGSSGAVLVGGQVIVGRVKGVERPPLAPLIPTEKGVSLLIDCGANVDARPSPGTVCPDGFPLYEICDGNRESACGDRQYRCGRGKGKCPCERDIPALKRV